ncbi:MAG: hypothetical protein CSYNP_02450 [Syntrophus sp. SKADARSKE-3]|nr:hypothetical protein [Syntrophus sp. SKADARSKE-3]
MNDECRNNQELQDENLALKRRIQELEQLDSKRQKVERSLRDIESRYRLLFEYSPVGIVIIDPSTARILEFNETAHRQLGYSRNEFSHLKIFDLEIEETPEETQLHISQVIREGRADFETRHRTKQGEIRNVYVTAKYIEFSEKPIYHCIWRDITEWKRSEEALRKSEWEKAAILDAMSEMVIYLDTHLSKIVISN